MVYNVLNGPYINNEGRRIVFVGPNNANRKCISYARYLMSEHLGRELANDEVVDHKDENKLNDWIDNYQILTHEDNAKKHNSLTPAKIYEFICPVCGESAQKFLRNVVHNWKQGKTGPFCSRQCARAYQIAGMVELADTADLRPAA